MSESLKINVMETRAAGRALAATSDDAGAAGAAVLDAAHMVAGTVTAGMSIGPSLQAAGEAFGTACAEMLSSVEGLGALVQDAADALAATEEAAIGRFRALAAI